MRASPRGPSWRRARLADSVRQRGRHRVLAAESTRRSDRYVDVVGSKLGAGRGGRVTDTDGRARRSGVLGTGVRDRHNAVQLDSVHRLDRHVLPVCTRTTTCSHSSTAAVKRPAPCGTSAAIVAVSFVPGGGLAVSLPAWLRGPGRGGRNGVDVAAVRCARPRSVSRASWRSPSSAGWCRTRAPMCWRTRWCGSIAMISAPRSSVRKGSIPGRRFGLRAGRAAQDAATRSEGRVPPLPGLGSGCLSCWPSRRPRGPSRWPEPFALTVLEGNGSRRCRRSHRTSAAFSRGMRRSRRAGVPGRCDALGGRLSHDRR